MPNFYTLQITVGTGTGQIFIDGDLVSSNGQTVFLTYQEGQALEFSVIPDSGYNVFNAISDVGGSNNVSPFNITMPSNDLVIGFAFLGVFEPEPPLGGYQLKYFWDYKNIHGEGRRLEIYEDGFTGEAEERKISNLKYIWGNLDSDPVFETFVRSKITFDIEGVSNEFQEFLTGNNRKYKAISYEADSPVFTGYVNTDVLVMPEKSGSIIMKFEALDGVKSFDSVRLIPQRSPFVDGAIRHVVGGLNQTFSDLRHINISCELFEVDMDRDQCLFEQFDTPFTALFTDGEAAIFSDGTRIVNEYLFISEVLKRLVNPFMCRIFHFKNEWFIIRLSEHQKEKQKYYRYNPDGSLVGSYELDNPYILACSFVGGVTGGEDGIDAELDFVFGGEGQEFISRFGNAERTARLIFNEFTATLKLGVLDFASRGGVFESKFNIDDFFQASAVSVNPPPGTFILRRWAIGNAQYVNEAIYGNTAGIQYVSNPNEFLQISGTTQSSGLSDPNISWIEINTQNTGINIPISQELSNTISINFEFQAIQRQSSDPINIVSHSLGVQVQIGDNWLQRDGVDAFEWMATPQTMLFSIAQAAVWNTLQISNIVVPETNFIKVRIFQLINTSATPHRYLLRLKNLKLDVEENEALTLSEISSKAQTLQDYNNTLKDYETFIGDALTVNSQSAIRLIPSNSVSKLWSRDGEEEAELLDILVQEIANYKGRRNLRIIGTQFRGYPDVTKGIEYDGDRWVVTHFNHDSMKNRTLVELFQTTI